MKSIKTKQIKPNLWMAYFTAEVVGSGSNRKEALQDLKKQLK